MFGRTQIFQTAGRKKFGRTENFRPDGKFSAGRTEIFSEYLLKNPYQKKNDDNFFLLDNDQFFVFDKKDYPSKESLTAL